MPGSITNHGPWIEPHILAQHRPSNQWIFIGIIGTKVKIKLIGHWFNWNWTRPTFHGLRKRIDRNQIVSKKHLDDSQNTGYEWCSNLTTSNLPTSPCSALFNGQRYALKLYNPIFGKGANPWLEYRISGFFFFHLITIHYQNLVQLWCIQFHCNC